METRLWEKMPGNDGSPLMRTDNWEIPGGVDVKKFGNRFPPPVGVFFGGMVVLLLLLPSHPFAFGAGGDELQDCQFPHSVVPVDDSETGEQFWK